MFFIFICQIYLIGKHRIILMVLVKILVFGLWALYFWSGYWLFFYYYSVTKYRTCIKNSLSRWTRIKFYFSLTWIENCRETGFSTGMICCRSRPHALNVTDMSLNLMCHLLSSGSAVYLSMCKKWIASKWFIASKIECENNNRNSVVKVSCI